MSGANKPILAALGCLLAAGGAPFQAWAQSALPPDFPVITVYTSTTPAPGYVFLSNFPLGTNDNSAYLMMLDNSGYPVKFRACDSPLNFDFKVQPGNQPGFIESFALVMTNDSPAALPGAWLLTDTLNTAQLFRAKSALLPPPPRLVVTDAHEFRLLTNGNALLLGVTPTVVDMSSVVTGGQANAKVLHMAIQEVTPAGALVWEWRTDQHFNILDTTPDNSLTASVIDYAHCNAVEVDTDGNLLLSSRHFDEITKINRANGDIIWRMGGSFCTNNQFAFENDVVHDGTNVLFFGFSHQHGIRRLSNGHVILFDNGNLKTPHISRVVEYELDESNKIARLIWCYTNDPPVTTMAMGYAQRLDNGNTVIGWGQNSNALAMTEVTAQGEKVFELGFPVGIYSYRAYRFVYGMDAVTLPVTQTGTYVFADNTYTTQLAVAVQTLTGTGTLTVARHGYAPHQLEYTGTAPVAVHPYRWVITAAQGLSNHAGHLYFSMAGLTNIASPERTLVYHRAREGAGSFAALPSTYDPVTRVLTSVYTNGGELFLGTRATGVAGDFNGDGKSDLAVYRDGYWSIYSLANGIILNGAGVWGGPDSITAPGDYDGDGKADLAVYRDGYWSIFSLANGIILNNAGPWGGADWIPAPGDYDGDGKADLAVYRDGYWSIFSLANGLIFYNQGVWGGSGWTPVY